MRPSSDLSFFSAKEIGIKNVGSIERFFLSAL